MERRTACSSRFSRLRVLSVGPQSAEVIRVPGVCSPYSCASSTGTEALNLLRSDVFDIVLCDPELPDMRAVDVLDDVRYANCDVPLLLTIAAHQLRDALLAMIAGACGYVIAGQSTDDIVTAIESARKRQWLNRLFESRPAGRASPCQTFTQLNDQLRNPSRAERDMFLADSSI